MPSFNPARAIKEAREGCGLMQKELAEALCTDFTTVSKLESGKRKVSAKMAMKLNYVLQIPIRDLYQVEGAE